jgi:hypothetical protein
VTSTLYKVAVGGRAGLARIVKMAESSLIDADSAERLAEMLPG